MASINWGQRRSGTGANLNSVARQQSSPPRISAFLLVPKLFHSVSVEKFRLFQARKCQLLLSVVPVVFTVVLIVAKPKNTACFLHVKKVAWKLVSTVTYFQIRLNQL